MEVVIIVPTNRPKDWSNILQNIKRQSLQPSAVIAVENGKESGWTNGATISVRSDEDAGLARHAGLEVARDKYPKSFFIMMDGDDYYGPEYIQEAYDNRNKADIIGKHVVFYRFDATDVYGIVFGNENKETKIVHGPTMCGHTSSALDFHSCHGWGEDLEWQQRMKDSGKTIYATSRFNFCGKRNKNIEDHTWTVPDVVSARTMFIKEVVDNATDLNWQDIVNGKIDAVYKTAPTFSLNIPELI